MLETTLEINLYDLWSLFVTVRWEQTEKKKGKFLRFMCENQLNWLTVCCVVNVSYALGGNPFKREPF